MANMPTTNAPSPALPASAPAAPTGSTSGSQTVHPITVQMPPPPKLEPWEVQGVLPSIAAVVAVVVTAASLHWNTSRNLKAAKQTTEAQLENARLEAQRERAHATEQAQRDRLVEARKAVYSELVDDYRKVQELIGGLASLDVDIPPDLGKPLVAMSASVTKLWIWGEVETVHEAREFLAQVNEMYFEALARCAPIFEKRRLLRSLKASEEKNEIKIERLQQQLHEFNLPNEVPVGDRAILHKKLSTQITHFFNRSSDLRHEIHRTTIELVKPVADYGQFVVEEQAKVMKQINRLMSAARSELGLAGDVAILEEQGARMSARAGVALERLKSSLSSP